MSGHVGLDQWHCFLDLLGQHVYESMCALGIFNGMLCATTHLSFLVQVTLQTCAMPFVHLGCTCLAATTFGPLPLLPNPCFWRLPLL
eukprot:scaffold24343_cov24-Tisochrysis_lutea.AAC.1